MFSFDTPLSIFSVSCASAHFRQLAAQNTVIALLHMFSLRYQSVPTHQRSLRRQPPSADAPIALLDYAAAILFSPFDYAAA
jgi:hypothetical protein